MRYEGMVIDTSEANSLLFKLTVGSHIMNAVLYHV